MLLVVSLIALMAALSFPAASAALDSIRLASAADSISAFLNAAVNRVERLQQPVAIVVEPARLTLLTSGPAPQRTLELPQGVHIAGDPHQLVMFPGGAIPRFAIELRNSRRARRLVSLDPITGIPSIRRPDQETNP
jgi:hypothetical protein